uniref:Uncharacterized protein n=1 Tax=Tanacetum cinerariifolium TaxID=118510 RepID=A0A699KE85_TANCI|nr:hypothetical protein [Tanacetum cinerariifolium]
MNEVSENCPWFIRSAPIILKKWTSNANLLKEKLNLVPIWLKFHDIPIVVFTSDGLIMGSYDYAHALIDIRADRELNEDMFIPIPNVEDDGEVLYMVRVEYECEPPRCGLCMMIEGTLMLLDDDEKPLKPSKPMLPSSLNVVSKMADGLVNKDNDSEVKEENHSKDPYDDDDFDDPGLTDA